MIVHNNIVIGLDTISFITTTHSLNKLLNELNLSYDVTTNTYIYQSYLREVSKFKNAKLEKQSLLYTVCLSNDFSNNLNNYIIIKSTYSTLSESRNHKKDSNYKLEVVFAGLSQYNKISIKTYEVLKAFIDRFDIFSFDVAIDGISELFISQTKKFNLDKLFQNYIVSGAKTRIFKSSYYINNSKDSNKKKKKQTEHTNIENKDTKAYNRILLYDKSLKNLQTKNFVQIENWKRIEVTIDVNEKFRELNKSNLNDYLEDCKRLANIFFGSDLTFDTSYFEIQQKSLSNKKILMSANSKKVLCNLKNIYDLNFRK